MSLVLIEIELEIEMDAIRARNCRRSGIFHLKVVVSTLCLARGIWIDLSLWCRASTSYGEVCGYQSNTKGYLAVPPSGFSKSPSSVAQSPLLGA